MVNIDVSTPYVRVDSMIQMIQRNSCKSNYRLPFITYLIFMQEFCDIHVFYSLE